jgi:hypothetical protein
MRKPSWRGGEQLEEISKLVRPDRSAGKLIMQANSKTRKARERDDRARTSTSTGTKAADLAWRDGVTHRQTPSSPVSYRS